LASSRKLLVQGHFVADQFARLFACFLSLPEHFSLTVQAENALSSFDRVISYALNVPLSVIMLLGLIA
jgi:hypothetical protein